MGGVFVDGCSFVRQIQVFYPPSYNQHRQINANTILALLVIVLQPVVTVETTTGWVTGGCRGTDSMTLTVQIDVL